MFLITSADIKIFDDIRDKTGLPQSLNMREIVVNRRVAIVDNIFDLLKLLYDELTTLEYVYLDINVLLRGFDCCMGLAIVKQRVEL